MQTFNLNPFKRVEIHFFKKKPGLLLMLVVFLFTSCQKDHQHPRNCDAFNEEKNTENHGKKTAPTVSVFATGLNNPRGLEFGPDCYLYVAEAGTGGTNNTSALCPQLSSDEPYLGSPTGGRISRISSTGERTTLTSNLPTTVSAGGDILGVADVAFIGNALYALLNGAGCSHGVPTVPNGIVRINRDGTFTVIADLGSWQVLHPVANPPADFEPEGTWYSMVSVGNDLYPMDSNHGELVKVTSEGTITRVVDFSANPGHIVPTAIDYHGNFYVGNLGTFPIVEGSSNIYKVTPDGQFKIAETGFTTILGLVFDNKKRMYVLENTTGNPFPTPGTGRIVRIDANGTREIIASGLSLPTGIAMGPDGNLYVSNWGFGAALGAGEVLKVTLND